MTITPAVGPGSCRLMARPAAGFQWQPESPQLTNRPYGCKELVPEESTSASARPLDNNIRLYLRTTDLPGSLHPPLAYDLLPVRRCYRRGESIGRVTLMLYEQCCSLTRRTELTNALCCACKG
jgi:hypothetical protein